MSSILKNLRRKKNNKKGFTLMELLGVVAIIVILLSLSGIFIFSYLRTLYQLKLDNTAKEIFISAQNHLSMIDGENYLGGFDESYFGTAELDDNGKSTGVYYFVVNKDTLDKYSDDTLLASLLPYAAIDDDIRSDNSFVIRYHKDQAIILDVFYAEPDGKYPHGFTKDEYSDLIENYRGDDKKKDRRKYSDTKAVIGYYGGVDEDLMNRINRFVAPKITIYNEEKLIVEIDNTDNSQTNGSLRLLITGKTSGKSKYIDVVKDGQMVSGNSAISQVGSNQVFKVVLDDITSPSLGFNAQFASSGLIPGENIIVRAIAYTNNAYTNIASSGKNTTNSLYASYDEDNLSCEVSNIRHIENLAKIVSNVSVEVDKATQISDITWGGSSSIFNKNNSIYEANGISKLVEGSFVPVEVTSDSFIYDGNNNHSITDIYVNTNTNNSKVNLLNGGLFSKLENGEVKNLRLVNFDIDSYNGYAGALVGSATNLKINNVIAYNSYKDDSNLSIDGNKNTGGLVGNMSGGKISASAAAVYVKSNNATAGGLVGSISSGEVIDSYAGGHTNDGRYTNNTTGKGRYNVIGSTNAGGLVGELSRSSISYSYSTASVKANNAGGLIGKANASYIDNVYCTGIVSGITNTDNFVAISENTCTYTGARYYLSSINENISNITGATAINASDQSGRLIIVSDKSKRLAYVHDVTLEKTTTLYPFKTISQWHNGAASTSITNYHYGDWQVPTLKSANFTFYNDDTLRLVIDVDKKESELTFALSGDVSNKTKIFQLKIQGSSVSVVKEGEVDADGNSTWLDSVVTELPISYDSSNRKITIVLDNITNNKINNTNGVTIANSDKSFYQIFGNYYIIGENISARVANKYNEWVEIADVEAQTQNTSFAKHDDGDIANAKIAYLRHLQNLDPVISNVDNQIKTAKQLDNIIWSNFYNSIHNYNGSKSIYNTFYGIRNENLTRYDGNYKELSNFVINSNAYKSFGGDYSNDAGLFRYVDSEMTLTSLKIKDFTISSTDGNAAVAIGEIGGNNLITIEDTLVTNESMNQKVTVKQSADNDAIVSAGGLVGRANAPLTIENSSASIQINSDVYAGGLVGIHDTNGGTLIIKEAYAGGHTSDAEYLVDKPEDYNIVSNNGTAGGLVGYADGSNINITKSFSTASVSAKNGVAGGIIGAVNEQANLDYVYVIAPVYKVKVNAEQEATVNGAFIGQIVSSDNAKVNNTNTYYLPEIYDDNETSSSSTAVEYVGVGCADKMNPVSLAYYTKDGKNNIFSSKISTDTLTVKTFVYDDKLDEDDKEYPFLIWTAFAFKENNNISNISLREYGTFYGDWQPLLNTALKTITATFYYKDPITGVVIQSSDENLAVQQIVSNKDQSVLLPQVESFAGYKIGTWTVYSKDGTKLAELVGSQGFITLSKEYITADLNIVANYISKGESSVIFMYDPSGNNQNYEKISGVEVKTNSYLKDVKPVPSREIDNYEFVGWFTEPNGQGEKLIFDSESTQIVNQNIVAYAQYKEIKYYSITVDFMYAIGEDAAEYLINVPRYRVKDKAQYQIRVVEGKIFDNQIDIKDVTEKINAQVGADNVKSVSAGKYNDEGLVEDSTEIQLDDKKTKVKVTTDKESHYVVTYYVTDTHSGEYKYNIKLKLNDTKTDTTEENMLEASQYEKDSTCTFIYDSSYGQIVGGIPQVPDIDLGKFEFAGFKCLTEKTDIKLIQVEGKDNEYDIIIEYERKKYTLVFDSTSGTYIEPVELTFGQLLSDGKPSTNPTRTGYTFDSWSLVQSSGSDSLTWNDRMPASQVTATAQWKPTDTTYKIIYWKQKVTDDRSLNLNGLDDQKTYDYAAMETKTAKTGTTVDGSFASSYSGTKTIGGKEVKLDGFKYLRSDSTTVAGDGSTVINVYFDRRVIRIHFSKSRTGDIDDLDGTNNYVLSTDENAIYALIDGKYETLIKKTKNGVTKYYRKVAIPTVDTKEYDDAYVLIDDVNNKNSGNWYLYENGSISSQYLYYERNLGSFKLEWYKTRSKILAFYVYSDKVDSSNIYAKVSENRSFSDNAIYYQFEDGVRYEVTKQSNGKYVHAEYTYTYEYVEWTGDRYSVKYPFIGLFEQPFSMYGYSWPQGKYNLGYYHGENKTGIVFLGAFIAPDTDKYNTEDIYIYRESSDTSVNFYFCLQNLEGEYENGEWDIGYSTIGSPFYFSNKYEGFEVAQYTNSFSTNPSNWNNTSSGETVYINRNSLYVGYERKTYSLDYVSVISGVLEDSIDTNGNSIKSQSVKFEDSLVKHKVTDIALTRDENGMTYTWNGKYYSDQACTKEFDFNSKMPSSNVAVYLKYVLREYTINFNINDPNANENPATYIDAENHQSTIVKEEGQTIDSIIANDNGSLKDAYKALKKGYVFDDSYWYYLDENGSETIKIYNSDGTYTEKKASKFINSQQLHGDTLTIDLYCRWYEEGEIEQVEIRDVTIRYILKSDEEEKTILADDTIEKNKYVNSNIIVKAKEIEGYYPEYTMQRYRVTESNNQVVYFEYNAIEAWNYDVEYYVRYRSYEEALDSDALGMIIESTDKVDTYLLSKEIDNKAYEQYAVIEFKTISGYENYHLVEYDFIYKNGDGEEIVQHGTGSTVTITPSYEDNEKVVIRYYLEPDVSKVEVNNIYTVYDGTDKRIVSSTDTNNIYSVPNDMISTTTDIYKYYDNEGNVLSKAVDAGAYVTKGYVVLTVNDNSDSENIITKNYLLYKTPDNSMSLVIGKRYIDINSADLSVKYDEQPHKKLEYTISGDVDGETITGTVSGEEIVYNSAPFVSGEGITIYSSADANRLEPGTTENGFTYELLDGTNANNYVITTNFGKIKVTWDYQIKVYAEYESIVDTTFNELLFDEGLSTETVNYLISESVKTNIAKKTVTIEESAIVPTEYSSYKLSRVVYNGNTIDNLPYDISPHKVDDSNYGGVLEVYLTLDTDEIIFNDVEELKHDAPEVIEINIKQLPTKINGYVDGDTYATEGLVVEARLNGGEVITLDSSQYSLSIIDGETVTPINDGDAVTIVDGETFETITVTYVVNSEIVDESESQAPAITTTFNIGIGDNEATNSITPFVEEIMPTAIKYVDDTTLAIMESYELSKIVVPYAKAVDPDDADEYIYSYLPRTKLSSISENDETYPIDLFEVIKIVGQATADEEVSTRYFLIKVDTSKQKSIKIIEQTTN